MQRPLDEGLRLVVAGLHGKTVHRPRRVVGDERGNRPAVAPPYASANRAGSGRAPSAMTAGRDGASVVVGAGKAAHVAKGGSAGTGDPDQAASLGNRLLRAAVLRPLHPRARPSVSAKSHGVGSGATRGARAAEWMATAHPSPPGAGSGLPGRASGQPQGPTLSAAAGERLIPKRGGK